jgi:deoxycytidylate deaminase
MNFTKGQLMHHIDYFHIAASVAKNATCKRSKCGTIIVDDSGTIIGKGFNSPPKGSSCRCECDKTTYHVKVTDKTCCIHAEQRAIFNALWNWRVLGGTLYFARLDENENLKPSGNPYCTICSKMALDCGIKFFGLYHKNGPRIYTTEEYNNLSYEYKG